MKQKSEVEGTERVRLGKGVGQGRRPENTRLKTRIVQRATQSVSRFSSLEARKKPEGEGTEIVWV